MLSEAIVYIDKEIICTTSLLIFVVTVEVRQRLARTIRGKN